MQRGSSGRRCDAKKKPLRLMKPPSRVARGASLHSALQRRQLQRVQAGRQLVGCLNERSNEHRNECAPHDKYVKFLLKLSSICCQFLTTSATNFVLVLGVSQTQLNSTSFSYFFSASFLAQQQFFPGTCSRSSNSSRSTHRSLSALGSWLHHAGGQARRLLISNF